MSSLTNLVECFDPDGGGVRKADLKDFIYYLEPARIVAKNALLAELREIAWEVKKNHMGKHRGSSNRRLSRQVSFSHEDRPKTPPIAARLRSQTREYPNPCVTLQRAESQTRHDYSQSQTTHRPRPTSTPRGSRNQSPYPSVPSPTAVEELIARSNPTRGRSASMVARNPINLTSRVRTASRGRNQHQPTEHYDTNTPSHDSNDDTEGTTETSGCNSYSQEEESPDDQPKGRKLTGSMRTSGKKQPLEPSDDSGEFSSVSEILNPHSRRNQTHKSTHRLWLDYSKQTVPRETQRGESKHRHGSPLLAKKTRKCSKGGKSGRLRSAMRKGKGTIPSGFSPPLPETFQPTHNLRQMSEHHRQPGVDQKGKMKKHQHQARSKRHKRQDQGKLRRQFTTPNHSDASRSSHTSESSQRDSEDSIPTITKRRPSSKAPRCECQHHHCATEGNHTGNTKLGVDVSAKITEPANPPETVTCAQIDPHLSGIESVPCHEDFAPPIPTQTRPPGSKVSPTVNPSVPHLTETGLLRPTIDPLLLDPCFSTRSQPIKEKAPPFLAVPAINITPNVSNPSLPQSSNPQPHSTTMYHTSREKFNFQFSQKSPDVTKNQEVEVINTSERHKDSDNPSNVQLPSFLSNFQEKNRPSQNLFPSDAKPFPNYSQQNPPSTSNLNYAPLSSNSHDMFSFGSLKRPAFPTNPGTDAKQGNSNQLQSPLEPVNNVCNTSSTSSKKSQFHFQSPPPPVLETNPPLWYAPPEQLRPVKQIPNRIEANIKQPPPFSMPSASPMPSFLSICTTASPASQETTSTTNQSPQLQLATTQSASLGHQANFSQNPTAQSTGFFAPSSAAPDTHITISLAQLQLLLSSMGADGTLPILQSNNGPNVSSVPQSKSPAHVPESIKHPIHSHTLIHSNQPDMSLSTPTTSGLTFSSSVQTNIPETMSSFEESKRIAADPKPIKASSANHPPSMSADNTQSPMLTIPSNAVSVSNQPLTTPSNHSTTNIFLEDHKLERTPSSMPDANRVVPKKNLSEMNVQILPKSNPPAKEGLELSTKLPEFSSGAPPVQNPAVHAAPAIPLLKSTVTAEPKSLQPSGPSSNYPVKNSGAAPVQNPAANAATTIPALKSTVNSEPKSLQPSVPLSNYPVKNSGAAPVQNPAANAATSSIPVKLTVNAEPKSIQTQSTSLSLNPPGRMRKESKETPTPKPMELPTTTEQSHRPPNKTPSFKPIEVQSSLPSTTEQSQLPPAVEQPVPSISHVYPPKHSISREEYPAKKFPSSMAQKAAYIEKVKNTEAPFNKNIIAAKLLTDEPEKISAGGSTHPLNLPELTAKLPAPPAPST